MLFRQPALVVLSDRSQYSILCVLITALAAAYAAALLVRILGRERPHLHVGRAVFAALVVRALAAGAVSLTSFGGTLRGNDELVFLGKARAVAGAAIHSPQPYDYVTSGLGGLHVQVFALQMKIFGLEIPDLALRMTEVGFAVLGLTLVAIAVNDLAGPRAGTYAAWILAFEPTSVFFSGVLHKEPLLVFAEGLVVFGGARMWIRPRLSGLLVVAAGCAIAVETRPYVGWFLVAASAAVILHASVRGRRRAGATSGILILGVLVLVAFTAPLLYNASSPQNLKRDLQGPQNANTTDKSNLKLEPVNYSTRGNVVRNVPRRVRDVLFRPYPWQVGNVAQQLGLLGTLVTLAMLSLLLASLWNDRGNVAARAGPILYPAVMLLLAYSLSAGNAGTAFRYRTHVLALGLAAVTVLRLYRVVPARGRPEADPRSHPMPSFDPTVQARL